MKGGALYHGGEKELDGAMCVRVRWGLSGQWRLARQWRPAYLRNARPFWRCVHGGDKKKPWRI